MHELAKLITLITNAFTLFGKKIDALGTEIKNRKPPVINVAPPKVEVTVPEVKVPPITVPEIKMPEFPPYPAFPAYPEFPKIEVPPIVVPEPKVTVNVPKADPPVVNVPAPNVTVQPTPVNFPSEMSVKGLSEAIEKITEAIPGGYSILKEVSSKTPIPIMVIGADGRQVTDFGGQMTAPSVIALRLGTQLVSASNRLPVDANFTGTLSVALDKDNDSVAIWANTAKDGTGTDYQPIVDNDGHLQVDVLSLPSVSISNFPATQVVSGSVTADTELPIAVELSDALLNPTTPMVGAATLGWQATLSRWGRVHAHYFTADNVVPSDHLGLIAGGPIYLFDGSNFDRARGDSANGMDVDVTRINGQAPDFGSGVVTGATQRVVVASDQASGFATETTLSALNGKIPDFSGTPGYESGTSGTVVLSGTKKVLMITAVALEAAGTMTINGGSVITIPYGATDGVSTGLDLPWWGNLVDPTIVFSNTDSYVITYIT